MLHKNHTTQNAKACSHNQGKCIAVFLELYTELEGVFRKYYQCILVAGFS